MPMDMNMRSLDLIPKGQQSDVVIPMNEEIFVQVDRSIVPTSHLS